MLSGSTGPCSSSATRNQPARPVHAAQAVLPELLRRTHPSSDTKVRTARSAPCQKMHSWTSRRCALPVQLAASVSAGSHQLAARFARTSTTPCASLRSLERPQQSDRCPRSPRYARVLMARCARCLTRARYARTSNNSSLRSLTSADKLAALACATTSPRSLSTGGVS